MVDAPVYPYFDIYPAVSGRWSPQPPTISGTLNLVLAPVKLETAYPRFDICKFGFLFLLMESKTDHTILQFLMKKGIAGQYHLLPVSPRLCLFSPQ